MGQIAKRFTFGDDSDTSMRQRKASRTMIQSSILRYVTSDRQHLAAENPNSILLRLPYHIRRRIYEYAGLSDGLSISLNYAYPEWSGGDVPSFNSEDLELIRPDGEEYEISKPSQRLARFLDGSIQCPNQIERDEPRCCLHYEYCGHYDDTPLLPSQLLDVCRAVSEEVERIFYSKSHFSICNEDTGRFSGLLVLKPRALSWMTSLSLDLYFDATQTLCPKYKPITEWERLCRHLTASIAPHQLKLSVLCSIADIESAKHIIKPMMQLPILAACNLRLSNKPFLNGIEDLARDAVLKLTGKSSDALGSPFRFTDLPREIQLHILQYTDLVTNEDIAWCPDPTPAGPKICKSSILDWNNGSAYDFTCCGKCSHVIDSCCCFLMHTAFSSSCTCWRMPVSLFSINRQMREDAIAIFYSQNHFLILPPRKLGEHDRPLQVLRFLTRFAAHGIKHLQSVTWMLPEYAYMNWGPRTLGEWDLAVDICAKEISLQRLSFTLDLSYHARRRSEYGSEYSRYRPLSISHLEDLEWHSGLSIVESMARHKGWKNVYVHLSWPWHNPDNSNDPYSSAEEARELREQQEAVLEQQVMGPDSVADGKSDRRHNWNGYICSCEDCGGEEW